MARFALLVHVCRLLLYDEVLYAHAVADQLILLEPVSMLSSSPIICYTNVYVVLGCRVLSSSLHGDNSEAI